MAIVAMKNTKFKVRRKEIKKERKKEKGEKGKKKKQKDTKRKMKNDLVEEKEKIKNRRTIGEDLSPSQSKENITNSTKSRET